MPTIANGGTAAGTLGYQDSVTIQTNGSARFECPTGTVVAEFRGSRTFGPYDNKSFTITSLQGALYYEVSDGSRALALTFNSATGSIEADGQTVLTAGGAVQTYTIAGSSIPAYSHTPDYTAVTIADQGNGRARVSGSGIAKQYRKGLRVKVGGFSPVVFNQFNSLILAHDTSTSLAWFEYDITGPFSPVVTTQELYKLNPIDLSPDSSTGFGAWAQQQLGRGWQCLGNFAIAGGDMEQNLALFDQTHGTVRPANVVFDLSPNDIYARGWTATRSIAAISAFVAKVRGIGARPIVFLMAPRNSGVTTSGGASGGGTRQEHLAVNAWARANLPALGCIVLDTPKLTANGTTFGDVASATLAANTGMTIDGVHDDRAGGRARGTALATALLPFVPAAAPIVASSAAEALVTGSGLPGNKFANVSFAARSVALPGGFSGSLLPDGTTASRNGTPTVVVSYVARTVAADGDAFGSNMVWAITSGANDDSVTFQIQLPSVAGWSAGDILRAAARLKLTSQTNVKQFTVLSNIRYINEDGIYAGQQAFVMAGGASATGLTTDDITGRNGIIEVPANRLRLATDNPATFDAIFFTVTVVFAGAGGATLTIAHPTITQN
jgi:hypothetical protein